MDILIAETDPDMPSFALDDISLWSLKAKDNGDQDHKYPETSPFPEEKLNVVEKNMYSCHIFWLQSLR